MREKTRVLIFVRKEGFYPLELPFSDDIERHAELNPGTLRVETVNGLVLWRAPETPPDPSLIDGGKNE